MTSHRLPPIEWRKQPGLLLTSKSQRKACFARDGGKCWDCKQIVEVWNADHDLALHIVPPSIPFPEALRYWRIDAIKTRCLPCHAIKTKSEAKSRAKTKRLYKKANGIQSAWEKKLESRKFNPVPKKVPWKGKKSIPSRHHKIISYISIGNKQK